ncbi:MAG: hypothetical protein HY937_01015 [Nitrosomonadales bacterium]|nr:hypothetical protein [Nitrosomonadales bacterium]
MEGSIGNDCGVRGVPENIGKQGILRYKQAGAITLQSRKEKACPWSPICKIKNNLT